jgi:hypothetical protein
MADGIFQGKRVSTSWDIVLTDAAKRVRFRLNSGRRTPAEQARLFAQNMHRVGGRWVPKPGHALTAFPTPGAPHYRYGRQNHSIDVDSFYGDGENALERELERMGLVIVNDVPGESWHQTEVDNDRLKRVAGRVLAADVDETPTLRKLDRGVMEGPSVRRLQGLLRGAGVSGVPLNSKYDFATRLATKRFQRKHSIPTDARATVGPKTWALLLKINR